MVIFIIIFASYLIFVITMSIRDYFKFTTDEKILEKKIQMKQIAKKSFEKLQKIKK